MRGLRKCAVPLNTGLEINQRRTFVAIGPVIYPGSLIQGFLITPVNEQVRLQYPIVLASISYSKTRSFVRMMTFVSYLFLDNVQS
jgi:hypothetical protein